MLPFVPAFLQSPVARHVGRKGHVLWQILPQFRAFQAQQRFTGQ